MLDGPTWDLSGSVIEEPVAEEFSRGIYDATDASEAVKWNLIIGSSVAHKVS